MDKLNPIAVNDSQYGGVRQESVRPIPVGLEKTEKARALGNTCAEVSSFNSTLP